jgi:hypothetical protein
VTWSKKPQRMPLGGYSIQPFCNRHLKPQMGEIERLA